MDTKTIKKEIQKLTYSLFYLGASFFAFYGLFLESSFIEKDVSQTPQIEVLH